MEESLAVVKFCRDIASPNFGFRMQLKKFADEQLEKVKTNRYTGQGLSGGCVCLP